MARVLVTGFEPFSNHSSNISADLIETLQESLVVRDPWGEIRDYRIDDIEIELETIVLSVDAVGAKLTSKKLSSGEKWDAIIHMGLCQNCQIPRIELLAQNIIDMSIEDNSGRQLRNRLLGTEEYKSTIKSELILTNKGSINAEISFDAGKFVCNETYYHTLSEIYHENTVENKTHCLFLHLPNYDNFSLPKARELLVNMIGRIMFKPVISVVAGAIINDGKMLVAKRNDERNLGLWEFPGGKSEWGESRTEAIQREIKEEFNWNVQRVKGFGKWFHNSENFDIELNVEICKFVGSIPDLEQKQSWTSHDEVKWISHEGDVEQFIGLDGLVAREIAKELLNPSGSFT